MRLGELVDCAAYYAAHKSRPRERPDGLAWPDVDALRALSAVNANELGFVDAVVAAEARTFTGTWFSTFSSLIVRLRQGGPKQGGGFAVPCHVSSRSGQRDRRERRTSEGKDRPEPRERDRRERRDAASDPPLRRSGTAI